MSRLTGSHPDSESLLLYEDGELLAAERRAIGDHLGSCRQCRAEVEEMERAVSAFIEYRDRLNQARGPISVKTAAQFRRKLDQIESELMAASPWRRASKFALSACQGRLRFVAAMVAGLAVAGAALVLVQHFVLAPPRKGPASKETAPPSRPALPVRPLPDHPKPMEPLSAPAPATPQDPASLEVAVLAKLHELGADLGEPVEVAATAQGIEIVCRQLAPERLAEIRAAVAVLPGVTVETSSESDSQERQIRGFVRGGGRSTALERTLAQELGGTAAFEQLANEILDAQEALMARVYALQTLEQLFPPGRATALYAADRAVLEGIFADHRRAAQETWAKMKPLLARPIRSLRPSDAAIDGQPVADLLSSARRLDRIINTVFGSSGTTLTVAESGGELAAASAQLSRALGDIR